VVEVGFNAIERGLFEAPMMGGEVLHLESLQGDGIGIGRLIGWLAVELDKSHNIPSGRKSEQTLVTT
jgi:hypothetical protein